MTKEGEVIYERVNKNAIKLTFVYPKGKTTEITARVVKPGSYSVCGVSSSAESGDSKKAPNE